MVDHQKRVYESMLELLPDAENPTPLVRLHRVSPFKHTKVYAKLEWYNPFGAVKDRVAANMIRDAEERGTLSDRRRLVEPTSGNTGMGLAMIANAKGYTMTATVSKEIPSEKRAALRLFGAEVMELADDLCPAPGAPEGAIALAAEIAERPGYHQLNQYKNAANPDAHFRTTGPEIWRQTDGKVTHFVAGLGTCGTITGTGRFLKERAKATRVLGVHPAEGHDIPGVRSLRQLKQTELFAPGEYDGLVEIDNEAAFRMALRLNREESIIAGPSSGMALAGAFRIVPDEPGLVCVVIFPDNAFKYTASMEKHLPELRAAGAGGDAPAAVPEVLSSIVAMARRSPDVIDVGEVERLLDKGGAVVIDVRGAEEYAEQRLESAIHVSLEDLGSGNDLDARLPKDKSTPILTVCNVGEKSLYAMLLLKALGHQKVQNLMGGMNAWISEGLPTESG
jgi:cysteine synthase/rhodanese-related sulfurtransferase